MADHVPKSSTRVSLLVRLAHAGPVDQDAWHDFATHYGSRMYQWCLRWGLQHADAQDVTQHVLVKLASVLRNFAYDPARSFRAWLRTLTHHAWQDFLSAQRRAGAGSGDSAVRERLATEPARDDFRHCLEEAFDHELLELASETVRGLVQPDTWEAFRLTAVEGVPAVEAARRLNKKIATVYVLRSKVQKLLREELQRLQARNES